MGDSQSIKLNGRYYRHHPPGNHLGSAEKALELDLDRTVFLLVDVYGKGYDKIFVNHIRPAKEAAAALALPIIYLTNYLAPSTNERTEWRKMSIRTLDVDVLEAWQEPNQILAFSDVIAPQPGEYLIKKQMYSGFFETHLDSLLRSLGAYNLVTVGFDLRICLCATVTDAMYRGYRVIVLRDCTATGEYPDTEEGQWATRLGIRFIETSVGYTTTSDEFIRACEALRE